MVVDTYVKAAHGKAQRDWPFISCSNNKFTEVRPDCCYQFLVITP